MIDQIKGQNGKILLSALAGITAGIIAGLLMAPESGKSTRQGLSQDAINFGEIVNKAF